MSKAVFVRFPGEPDYKAAFVMDQPPRCSMCPMSGTDACRAALRGDSPNFTTLPAGCPLKRVPDKKRVYPDEKTHIGETRINIANAGWNACLDTLMGKFTELTTDAKVIAAAERQDKEQGAYEEAVLHIAQNHNTDAMDFTMLKEFSLANILIGDMIRACSKDEFEEYDCISEQPAEIVRTREAAVKQLAKLKVLMDVYVLLLGAADGELDGYVRELVEKNGEEIEKDILKL